MTKARALQVKVGDMIVPNSRWNKTSGRGRKLAVPTKVLAVRESRGCQTGVMFRVRFESGTEVDRKSTRLNSSHLKLSRMPSSA